MKTSFFVTIEIRRGVKLYCNYRIEWPCDTRIIFLTGETERRDEAYNKVLDIVSKNIKGFYAELKVIKSFNDD